MKKIAFLFAFGLLAASFVGCGSPAEVKTKEKGSSPLLGAQVGTADGGGNIQSSVTFD